MFFTLNEEIKIKTNKKLRDAIHDIITTLETDEYFDLGTISNILRDNFGLFVTPKLLERLFTLWDDDKDSIFIKDDKTWLSWDDNDKILENNLKKKKRPGVLGKSRRRILKQEKSDKLKSIRKSGWIKLRDGRFVYKGPKSFKVDDNDIISISKYEKETYTKNQNPITTDLVRKVFVLFHPNDADDIVEEVDNFIHNNPKKIGTRHKDGDIYYYECFRKMLTIGKEMELDTKRGWEKKYAPSKYKEKLIRRNKRIEYEKQQEKDAMKTVIKDRDTAIEELGKIINLNEKYFVLVTKYSTSKGIFYIKKIIYGYISISKEKFENKNYRIIVTTDKDSDDEIIFFNSMMHFEKCLKSGLKAEDKHVFNIIKGPDIEKLKLYFGELKKYKGWDEYLDEETTNEIKNDF